MFRSKYRGKEKGWTDMVNQIKHNVRHWPLCSDSHFKGSLKCYKLHRIFCIINENGFLYSGSKYVNHFQARTLTPLPHFPLLQLINWSKNYIFGPLHIERYRCDRVKYFIKILNASPIFIIKSKGVLATYIV